MMGVEVTEGEKEVRGEAGLRRGDLYAWFLSVKENKYISCNGLPCTDTGKRSTLNKSLFTNAAQD